MGVLHVLDWLVFVEVLVSAAYQLSSQLSELEIKIDLSPTSEHFLSTTTMPGAAGAAVQNSLLTRG